ncbi:MAG: metallophosphoesterase, partial [Notoacmeibacter sp.]
HLQTLNWISGIGKTKVPVVCVSAAGQMPGGKRPAASWNEFQIERRESGFSIELIRRQITSDGKALAVTEQVKLS